MIMKEIAEFFNKLLDYIYKKKCYFCGKSNESVKMCSKCYEELSFNDVKENRYINGVKVYSAGLYDKNLQKMIRGIKYHKQKELAFYMAKFMWNYFSEIIKEFDLPKNYQVVPVPLHKARQKKRGYNHMELVAEEFCRLSGFSPNYELITRIKNTKPQYKLSYSEKQTNLQNAFKVDKTKLLNLPVLIIDDICTSGATFGSMIEEMKSQGVLDITCFAVSSP